MTEQAEQDLRSLYIRLYLDEDVSVEIGYNLQTRGFDVLSTRDAARLSKEDVDQLAFAVSQQRTMVTHNREDFELQHQQYIDAGFSHYGIVIAKRRANDSMYHLNILGQKISEV
jgi:hypothetical protein